ncbi:hypothetical protein HDE_10426 [Halotydeus destructor]|nr:hypothetical protein HDE_10426 [Halotydeus destructor]
MNIKHINLYILTYLAFVDYAICVFDRSDDIIVIGANGRHGRGGYGDGGVQYGGHGHNGYIVRVKGKYGKMKTLIILKEDGGKCKKKHCDDGLLDEPPYYLEPQPDCNCKTVPVKICPKQKEYKLISTKNNWHGLY